MRLSQGGADDIGRQPSLGLELFYRQLADRQDHLIDRFLGCCQLEVALPRLWVCRHLAAQGKRERQQSAALYLSRPDAKSTGCPAAEAVGKFCVSKLRGKHQRDQLAVEGLCVELHTATADGARAGKAAPDNAVEALTGGEAWDAELCVINEPIDCSGEDK